MIKRNRGLLLLAILVLLIGLVVMFPARIAYHWASPPFVAMSGIHGTVWNGGAREFSTNGVYLRDLRWTMRPLGLLGGKAAFAVSGSPVPGFLEADLAVSLSGKITLSHLTASVPLAMFERASNVPGLRGSASLEIERLELVDGRATALDGAIDVANLMLPMIARSSLGGYRAEFFTQDNGVVASVEDANGVVDLAGSLQLNQDKSYTFLGQVAARPNTPESLRQQLRYLGTPDERGLHELRLEGSY